MLDQNTDRMWYVIGAVLIGAAIILIANGSLPQLFANVGESMKTPLINSLAHFEADTQIVLLEDSFSKEFWEDGGLHAHDYSELNNPPWLEARIRHKDYYAVDYIETFAMTFNHANYMVIPAFHDEEYNKLGAVIWYTEDTVVEVPDNAKYVRFIAAPADRDGGGNDSGIGLDEFDALNIQFELVDVRAK